MDEFLQEGEKQGSVFLKEFTWQALLPENSATMKVIHEGILRNQPFEIQSSLTTPYDNQ